ncbi:hypothetical protein Vadar_001970 [Vaccinium darrowii]|uniref:Uncharacterized protein n=1 Tax=Vaccinium darrowii TaxID=229202 RepID=A0ACB7X772_9ERIC|nr:hypothetical protein Vadar_001970 [Vaccinium darrowii]
MGASLLRLHFHDCFVNTAIPNNNSLRGFDVVAKINNALTKECGDCVVSCADMLAMAANNSVASLGGPRYEALLGRQDSKTASFNAVLQNLPAPFFDFATLVTNFQDHFLNLTDLVVLSSAHTIGFARCINFAQRIYNDADINPTFQKELQRVCPDNPSGVNASVLWPLDNTTTRFDTRYYQMLLQQTGLLHSDQELYSGGNSTSADMVTYFSNNPYAFFKAFTASILKMGNLPPTNSSTEVRCNCSIPNPPSPPPPPPSPSPRPTPSPESGPGLSVGLGIEVHI